MIQRNQNPTPARKWRSWTNALLAAIWLTTCCCKGYLEVDPPKNSLAKENVNTSLQTASAVLDGIYSRMISGTSGFASGGLRSITLLAGLSADELDAFSDTYLPFQNNQLDPADGLISAYLWAEPYQYIYTVNSLLESIGQSNLTTSEIDQISGEAKFVRAFCYFYLTALFGEAPLHLTTDYQQNRQAHRAATAQVYQQVIADLNDARGLLTKTTAPSFQRTRPTYWAATALLARTYLYTRQYDLAQQMATELISEQSLFRLETDLTKVFTAESSEAIWQLKPGVPNINTHEGNIFILTGRPARFALSARVQQAFEADDLRGKIWISSLTVGEDTYLFPFKYRIAQGTTLQEYSMVLRLAEQYLIRAEARAMTGDLAAAAQDLATIRGRAGLSSGDATSAAQLLGNIFQERRRELFAEWGHRWFDVNRALDPDSVFSAKPSSRWQPSDRLYPVPFSEINNNPNISQNPGY